MSVLSSLVYKDQDKAVDFINQLSKVYRYLLDSGSCELTTLEDEMQFLQSYTYLLNIRYSPNIHFEIAVSEDALKTHIPPMSVQLLIENAIKHNEISSAAPLTISIRSEEMWLIVENNLQLRSTVENGSGTGLKNIRSRYQYFTDSEPEVTATETHFHVKIPLLKAP
jgi:LytS/YehU family sensor histidine kinase